METIRARRQLGDAAHRNCHEPHAVNRDFLATLLAIAGHDLRQPLRVITGAHYVPGRSVQRRAAGRVGAGRCHYDWRACCSRRIELERSLR
jgi:signal transduction histidine kinase